MKPSTYDKYTAEELERIDWFKNAGPCLRELMIQTYVFFLGNIEDEGIKKTCRLLLRGMRKEI